MNTNRSNDDFFQQLSLLVMAQGISHLSVAQIAARLRCSRRRLYEVAKSKDGLLVEVAEGAFEIALRKSMEVSERGGSAAQRITDYMGIGIELSFAISEPFHRDLENIPAGRAALDHFQAARAKGLRDLIEDGIRRKELGRINSLVAAELMFAAAVRIRRPEFLDSAGITMAEAYDAASHIILNGMLSKSSPPRQGASKGKSAPVRSPRPPKRRSGRTSD